MQADKTIGRRQGSVRCRIATNSRPVDVEIAYVIGMSTWFDAKSATRMLVVYFDSRNRKLIHSCNRLLCSSSSSSLYLCR